jgi:aspartyl aminopeptidase
VAHRPVLRIPQLAIHLDVELHTGGLKLDPQKHLVPIWSLGEPDAGRFLSATGAQGAWLGPQLERTVLAAVAGAIPARR